MPAVVKAKLKNLVPKETPPKANPWSLPARNVFAALRVDVEDTDDSSGSPTEHESVDTDDGAPGLAVGSTEAVESDDSNDNWQTVGRSNRVGSDDSHKFSSRPANVRMTDWNAEKQKRKQSTHGSPLIENPLIGGNGKNGKNAGERSRKFDHRVGARTRDGIPFADIKPGVMIFHYDVRPMIGTDSANSGDRQLTFNVEDVKWLRKGRFWLVVSFHDDHVVEVPIYTFHGKGLEAKPARIKEFYNSVKAPWFTVGVDFLNQSPNQRVLEIEWLDNENENLRVQMVAGMTEPISRTVDADWGSRIVGRLSKNSTEELLRRVRSFIGGADTPEANGSPRL